VVVEGFNRVQKKFGPKCLGCKETIRQAPGWDGGAKGKQAWRC
jgi:hypothetical protein